MRKVTVLTIGLLVLDRTAKAIAYYGISPLDGWIWQFQIMVGFGNSPNPGYIVIPGHPALSWLIPMARSAILIVVLFLALWSDLPREIKTASMVAIIAEVSQLSDQILYRAVIDYLLIDPIMFNIADIMLWSSWGAIAIVLLRMLKIHRERSLQNARP